MGNQPHIHTTEEARSNISKIEHNTNGPGPGPGGKKGGAPVDSGGGSGSNINTGNGVNPTRKGADWLASMKKG